MPITKMHFQAAADIVNNIRRGQWTNEFPQWAGETTDTVSSYGRAVWTAEAFCHLFADSNPRFDRDRFLRACGFAVKG